MKISKNIIIVAIIATIGFASCSKDLDVEYLNKPDTKRVLSSPDGVYALTQGLYYNWFMAMNSSWSPCMIFQNNHEFHLITQLHILMPMFLKIITS